MARQSHESSLEAELPDGSAPTARAHVRLGGAAAIWRGAAGFGAVSFLVYLTVAFGERWLYQNLSVLGSYALWAALFMICTPLVLGKLLVSRSRRRGFAWRFDVAFIVYAVVWTGCYFVVQRERGEWLASIAGPACMGILLAMFSRAGIRNLLPGVLGLVIGHTLGYFAGRWAHGEFAAPVGMISWGCAYGIGFGSGIGWALDWFGYCSEPVITGVDKT